MSENKLSINNLLYALLFLVFGIFLMSGTETIIGIISKIIGTVFIVVGIVKVITYIYMKGKVGDYSITNLFFAFLVAFLGVILIMYSEALSLAIRVIIGIWILFASINRIIMAISVKNQTKEGFLVYFISSIIMFASGILLITGVFSQILGIFVIIYALLEIVDYIYFKVTYKEKNVKTEKKSNKKNKKITSKKTVEANYEETE